MKEATGELNMTVITVVAIAAISLLFTMFVWPNIQASITLNTACSNVNANGNYESGEGETDGTISCQSFDCTVWYNDTQYSRTCTDR